MITQEVLESAFSSLSPVAGGPEETFGISSHPKAPRKKTEMEKGQNSAGRAVLDEECS